MGKTLKGIDELSIDTIRMLSADAVQKANSGHPGMPMGDAAMAYVLWDGFLKHNPKNPLWQNRDRFVLSAGHGSMLLYSLLHLTGHDISLDDIKNFRQLGSKTPGHPEYCPSCGIETTTGPLGQGFATGVGMAMAEDILASTFNKPGFPIVDYNIYGIVSDGDLMEGISSEAASLAGHLKLGKIVYLYSDNKITIEGSTDLAFTEDVGMRFAAFGWQVLEVDGNDIKSLTRAVKAGKQEKKRPTLIVARTQIGCGSPNKQGSEETHGSPLGNDEIRLSKEFCGFPTKDFYIPPDVLKHMKQAVKNGKEAETKWKDLFKKYKAKYPDMAKTWDGYIKGDLPKGWNESLPVFKPTDPAIATRSASGKALNALADKVMNLVGGSADLAPSNNTELKKFSWYMPGKPGRNIHFGVREHAMGAILNGMALSGMLIPFGGTFLVFFDYMKPAVRLAALMGQPVKYVYTHDSIGLGEDGPTHQPIEHLASLRSIPNLLVIRPSDANETVEAWKVALENKTGPTALVLSRQNLPILDRAIFAPAENLSKGGYVIADCKGKPDLIILSSGAEIHICLKAASELKAKGKKVRVVNMPCFELFDKQDKAYKKAVLPDDVRSRLAVEAGATMPWYKYVGLDGAVIGLDSFGESAPAKVLFEKFGFTAENVLSAAERLIASKR